MSLSHAREADGLHTNDLDWATPVKMEELVGWWSHDLCLKIAVFCIMERDREKKIRVDERTLRERNMGLSASIDLRHMKS